MPEFMPLTEKQLESLPQHTDPTNPKYRFITPDGRSICIVSGEVAHHMIYWDRPEEFVIQVVKYLNENNPGTEFRAVIIGEKEAEAFATKEGSFSNTITIVDGNFYIWADFEYIHKRR